jgi:DNA-binding protein HU-beta
MTKKTGVKNYNKAEFVDFVAKRSDYKKYESEEAINVVIDSIMEVLKAGGSVNFIGFGKFSVGERGARKGRNPKTGESMDIPPSKTPRFHAGELLKDAVSGK